jgi:hypothetical protein
MAFRALLNASVLVCSRPHVDMVLAGCWFVSHCSSPGAHMTTNMLCVLSLTTSIL